MVRISALCQLNEPHDGRLRCSNRTAPRASSAVDATPGSPLALRVRLTRRCCLAPANTGRFECRTTAS